MKKQTYACGEENIVNLYYISAYCTVTSKMSLDSPAEIGLASQRKMISAMKTLTQLLLRMAEPPGPSLLMQPVWVAHSHSPSTTGDGHNWLQGTLYWPHIAVVQPSEH